MIGLAYRQVFLAALVCAVFAVSAESQTLITPAGRAQISDALKALNMAEEDLSFEKDLAEPALVVPQIREVLERPLVLSELAADVLQASTSGVPSIIKYSAALLSTNPAVAIKNGFSLPSQEELENIPESLHMPLLRFLWDAGQAVELINLAFDTISPEEREYAAAVLLSGTFSSEDHAEAKAALGHAGISMDTLERVQNENRQLDPAPFAAAYLDIVGRINITALGDGASLLWRAAQTLMHDISLEQDLAWPEQVLILETDVGKICIGTLGQNTYTNSALLILDPGGDDVYSGSAGAANGLMGTTMTTLLDLGGDDFYQTGSLPGVGCALLGAAILDDRDGNDHYESNWMGQGTGLFGVGILVDGDGHDIYRARALAQGAGVGGMGILIDGDGNDNYRIGFEGQGYAGVRGFGVLLDGAGQDVYFAGGLEPDFERHKERFVSLSQGFAIGMRPFSGGGLAALIDVEGNDVYQADVYGQGVSYWYAAGMLLDLAGNDNYFVYEYGQGSGIHLSSGLLYDRAGHDVYTGYSLAQGAAHDYGVGFLLDGGGNDTYTADHQSQGRGMNNALGLLMDVQGKDAYFARELDSSQGIGNMGAEREYGSLALLLDLEGDDQYSCDTQNGQQFIRPNFGVVFDVQAIGEDADEE